MSEYLKEPWLARFLKWLGQYLIGFTWVWQKFLWPIISAIFSVYKIISSAYIKLWKKTAYKDGKFRRYRAGMTIICTFMFLWVIPSLVHIGYQSTLFAFTSNYETIYLTNSQEIKPDEDIHAIKGCEALPCTEDNAVYYHVRPTGFHHLYSFWHRGSVFYPDLVASVVAPGYNECHVKSYGIRMKTLMHKYDVYPDMLDAVCKPAKSNAGQE